jgi:hypothetical protein
MTDALLPCTRISFERSLRHGQLAMVAPITKGRRNDAKKMHIWFGVFLSVATVVAQLRNMFLCQILCDTRLCQ